MSSTSNFLKDKIAVLASALGLLQRSLVVFCERPEYFGQGPAWGTIMARSRVYCNLLGLATCDGGSLCRGLSKFRVKRPGGKQNNWSSNFDPECRKVLIKEVGKLCHLAELLPLRSEIARGARNRDGRVIEFGEHLVIVLPDREVEQEPAAEEEKALAEDADADVTVEELTSRSVATRSPRNRGASHYLLVRTRSLRVGVIAAQIRSGLAAKHRKRFR